MMTFLLLAFLFLTTEGKTICNPVDLSYRFALENNGDASYREAADPSIVLFKDEFYLFASKSSGYFHSTDMVSWDLIVTDEIENQESYAPTAVVAGDSVLWMTSSDGRFYKSTDPKSGHWNLETNEFPQREVDPSLLWDNGRLYWYGGCSNENPIWAVEVNASTYQQIGERVVVIQQNVKQLGWERGGDNNQGVEQPWVEGSWPTKIGNKYYLEYSIPGTEMKGYCSAIYTSSNPLGPFTVQPENPLTIKEGGYACGAGHGSTYLDPYGNYWHIGTVTVSKRFMFERRLQINPLFVDADGALWGYTGFGDWPKTVPTKKITSPSEIDAGLVLLSYKKPATASSTLGDYPVENAVDEEIRTWWSAEDGRAGQWYRVDLGSVSDVGGVQVNFADQDANLQGRQTGIYYQYVLEGSEDGVSYTVLADYSKQTEDHPHQYTEVAAKARYIRVTNVYVPSGRFSLSGLRVFGVNSAVAKPAAPAGITAERQSDRRGAIVKWTAVPGAVGYNVRFGTAPNKLYQNQIVYDTQLSVYYLNSELDYVFTVDAFSEGGVTFGTETVAAEGKRKDKKLLRKIMKRMLD